MLTTTYRSQINLHRKLITKSDIRLHGMNTSYDNEQRSTGSWLSLSSRAIGVLAGIVGLLGASYLIVTSVLPYFFSDSATLAAENAPTFLVWSIVLIGLAFGAGYVAWNEKLWAVWGFAIVISILSVATLFSFGAVVIPVAILLLIAAILLTVDQKFRMVG